VLSGIVDPPHMARIVQRMLQPDMFSGWGIRTLSSQNPAFNPFAYHRGTIWPVEQGAFALAFGRSGFWEPMWTLSRAVFESAALFENLRLPETFAGHQRDKQHPFPGLYEKADSPQAWSASAPIAILQALLGIDADAPSGTLYLDPKLPEWLPEINVESLRVGNASVSLRFCRNKNDETEFDVLATEGELKILRQRRSWPPCVDDKDRLDDRVEALS
jgi:glycogen debranching enzyme